MYGQRGSLTQLQLLDQLHTHQDQGLSHQGERLHHVDKLLELKHQIQLGLLQLNRLQKFEILIFINQEHRICL